MVGIGTVCFYFLRSSKYRNKEQFGLFDILRNRYLAMPMMADAFFEFNL